MNRISKLPFVLSQSKELIRGSLVTIMPAAAGILRALISLRSRVRGNDDDVVVQRIASPPLGDGGGENCS